MKTGRDPHLTLIHQRQRYELVLLDGAWATWATQCRSCYDAFQFKAQATGKAPWSTKRRCDKCKTPGKRVTKENMERFGARY